MYLSNLNQDSRDVPCLNEMQTLEPFRKANKTNIFAAGSQVEPTAIVIDFVQ